MPYAQVNGIQLYYELHGEGEPLVLIPGFGTGRWLWFKQADAFADQFRTIVFDPRGVGNSEEADGQLTIRAMADDVAGLLSALGIERAHVLGVSFGGFVAQEFALSYPQAVRRLVLCCTSLGGARHLSARALQAVASTRNLNSEERTRRNLLKSFSPKFVTERPEEVGKVIGLRLRNPVSDQTHIGQLQAAAAFDAEARISRIEAPTLVITGDEDAIVTAGNARPLAARIARAKLLVIEGAGHLVFIERAEEFNRSVVEFFSEPHQTQS
ncbi:MAG: alpha/beta fold hydrolase [Pyrinomonadaceae bacterium]